MNDDQGNFDGVGGGGGGGRRLFTVLPVLKVLSLHLHVVLRCLVKF